MQLAGRFSQDPQFKAKLLLVMTLLLVSAHLVLLGLLSAQYRWQLALCCISVSAVPTLISKLSGLRGPSLPTQALTQVLLAALFLAAAPRHPRRYCLLLSCWLLHPGTHAGTAAALLLGNRLGALRLLLNTAVNGLRCAALRCCPWMVALLLTDSIGGTDADARRCC